MAIFHHLLDERSNVIEVGSNIGMHAVPIARRIPAGKLFCFEPQRIIFQQLCCNLALNDLTNVHPFRMGVCNDNGKIWIEGSDYDEAWNYGSFSLDKGFSTESDFTGNLCKEEIETTRLDDFAPLAQLDQLSLLKIDAEGFDIPVLAGAQNLIARLQPAIFIEVHPHTFAETLAAIDALDYDAFWVASHRYQAANFFGAEQLDDSGDMNLLCFPKTYAANPSAHQAYAALSTGLVKATSIEQLYNEEVPLLTIQA